MSDKLSRLSPPVKIRVTSDYNIKGKMQSCPFILSYEPGNSKPFRLYSCSMTYDNLSLRGESISFDQLVHYLDKAGFENINLLFKDREHLEKFKFLQKKTGIFPVSRVSEKEKEEVEEGLQYLKEQIKTEKHD